MVDAYILLLGIVLLSLYGVYQVKKYSKEKTQIIESQNFEPLQEQKTQNSKVEESKIEAVYQFQTHKVKYLSSEAQKSPVFNVRKLRIET